MSSDIAKDADFGRIWFAGNPWPKGHRIIDAMWNAQLDPATGLWFHLHLKTADYDEDGFPEAEGDSDWTSPGLWHNYHACTLSSREWQGEFPGFLAAELGQLLHLSEIADHTFRVDAGHTRANTFEPAFGIYLTGHDSVADHTLRFSPRADSLFDLDWRGKVALSYAGDDDFDYQFHAEVRSLRFDRIGVPADTDPAQLLEVVAALLPETGEWRPGEAVLAPGYRPAPALVRQ